MSDGDRDLEGLSPEEEALAGLLAERAELLRQIERASLEMDATFVRTLRAHLQHGEELAPHPTFARRLRNRLMPAAGARTDQRNPRRLLPWLAAAALSVTVIVVTALNLPRGQPVRAPYPTRADLLFNLPLPGTAVVHLSPTRSLVHPVSAAPYAGRVHFRAAGLPKSPSNLRSYRLSAPAGVADVARRELKIRAPVRRTRANGATWLVAADGGTRRRPLHSLAVSTATGELIYHDRRNFLLPRAPRAAPRAVATRAARAWLTRLGWPGDAMPVRSVGIVARLRRVRQVVLGWAGAGAATIEEATVWVAPDRSIIEAWVWPPVVQSEGAAARSVISAWSDITTRRAPLIVLGALRGAPARATAALRRVRATLVLVPGSGGASYLVPAYRFEGTIRAGAGTTVSRWVGLAPGASR